MRSNQYQKTFRLGEYQFIMTVLVDHITPGFSRICVKLNSLTEEYNTQDDVVNHSIDLHIKDAIDNAQRWVDARDPKATIPAKLIADGFFQITT